MGEQATIKVTLVLVGGLKTPSGQTRVTLSLREGSTLASAVEACGLRLYEVMGGSLNKSMRRLDEPLHDGEEIEVLPVISGGD